LEIYAEQKFQNTYSTTTAMSDEASFLVTEPGENNQQYDGSANVEDESEKEEKN
jgi:hypothetical protein